MQQQIENVHGSHQRSGGQHLQLLPDMGLWGKRGKPQGQAEHHNNGERNRIKKIHGNLRPGQTARLLLPSTPTTIRNASVPRR